MRRFQDHVAIFSCIVRIGKENSKEIAIQRSNRLARESVGAIKIKIMRFNANKSRRYNNKSVLLIVALIKFSIFNEVVSAKDAFQFPHNGGKNRIHASDRQNAMKFFLLLPFSMSLN